MKPCFKSLSTLLSITSLVSIGCLACPSSAQAQFSGGIFGLAEPGKEKLHEPGFRITTKNLSDGTVIVSLAGDFQKGSPDVHAFLFDWEIGALVGSDAADSLIQKFDGGDGPDYLVGSDAADSFGRVRLVLNINANSNEMPAIRQVAADLHQLITFAYDTMSFVVPSHGLKATGNEVAIFEEYGVSLQATGNEVAIVQPLDARSVESRWIEWSLLSDSADSASLITLATELDILLMELEFSVLTEAEFATEVESAIDATLLFFGFLPEMAALENR